MGVTISKRKRNAGPWTTQKIKHLITYDEYVRIKYWNKAQAREIRQRNPVNNKSIGGRTKAITAYLNTKTNKVKTLALLRCIKQVKKSQKDYKKCGVKVQSEVAWSVWRSRTSVELTNDHQVLRRVTRWASKELARMNGPTLEFNPKSVASPQRLKRVSQK